MPDTSPAEKEKVSILLAEYNSLRAEILERNAALCSGVTTVFPVIGGLIPLLAKSLPIAGLSFSLVVLMMLMAYRIVLFDILRLAARVRELEAEINRRTGERLLTWETDHGFIRVGAMPRILHAVGPVLRWSRFWKADGPSVG